MKLYELIIVLHPSLSTQDSQDLLAKLEGLFPNGIKQKDDIGYQTVYNIHGIAKGGKAYFVSYLLDIDPNILPEVRQKMSLMKGLVRTLFLAQSAKTPFHMFNDINKAFSEKVSSLMAKDKKGTKTRKSPVEKVSEESEKVELVVEDDEQVEA